MTTIIEKLTSTSVPKVFRDGQVYGFVGNYYGDEGKGRISSWALENLGIKLCIKGNGADNAGHTTYFDGDKIILNNCPAGVLYGAHGIDTLVSAGACAHPERLLAELERVRQVIGDVSRFYIDSQAHVILNWHMRKEAEINGDFAEQTTKKGISPSYATKAANKAILFGDLPYDDILLERLIDMKEDYDKLDIDEEMAMLQKTRGTLEQMVINGVSLVHKHIKLGNAISIEGGQSVILDTNRGKRPYGTASSTIAGAIASIAGIPPSEKYMAIGATKLLGSRVGYGPVVGELGAKEYAELGLLNSSSRQAELTKFGIPFSVEEDELGDEKVIYDAEHPKIMEMVNSPDDYTQSVGLRLRADEYGATTSRPRRVAWFDCVAAKYAGRLNGPKTALTKVDVLEGVETLKVVRAYEVDGVETTEFNPHIKWLEKAKPVYHEFEGFPVGSTRDAKTFEELPSQLKRIVDFIERHSEIQIPIVTNGPQPDKIIFR